MFEGIDDSSDDESLNSTEGSNDDGFEVVVGRIELEGVEVGRVDNRSSDEKGEGKEGEHAEASRTVVV